MGKLEQGALGTVHCFQPLGGRDRCGAAAVTICLLCLASHAVLWSVGCEVH